jgi:hypothetical protein
VDAIADHFSNRVLFEHLLLRKAHSSGKSPIMPKQMHLAHDVSCTQVESAWSIPGSWVGRHHPDVGLFEDIAWIAERGLFALQLPSYGLSEAGT